MCTDTKSYSIKNIIDQFEDKPKNTFMTIKVDHFSMNFKANLLKRKIEQFAENPKKIRGRPFTDYELAILLD